MPKLYVVPTPIGNLEDITFRAVRVLKEVDRILVEDTRVSKRLLDHYGIPTRMIAYHKFNEHKSIDGLLDKIESGTSMALISDAGTPGISDPGYLIIRESIKRNIPVESLPGATAFIPALLNSGLPADRFHFEGFLPVKKGRQTRLKYLAGVSGTLVLYESPHRLLKTLRQLAEILGPERKASVSRELSKIFEENTRNSLQGLIDYYQEKKIRGEIVIVVAGE